jgi:hypothetical protein
MPATNIAGDAIANEVLVAGELLALDEFIAGVLRRAHESLEPGRSPSEHRAIFQVARLFADELERTDPSFDRLRFIDAVAEGFRHA